LEGLAYLGMLALDLCLFDCFQLEKSEIFYLHRIPSIEYFFRLQYPP